MANSHYIKGRVTTEREFLMTLGNLIAEMLQSGEGKELSRAETENLIEDFVDQVAASVEEYRADHRIPSDALSLINFR